MGPQTSGFAKNAKNATFQKNNNQKYFSFQKIVNGVRGHSNNT